jgi:CBS domain-containing protein
MRVADVMSSPPYTVRPGESLARAAQIMWNEDTGVVPVVDGERRAIAMITDRDICMAAYTQGRPLAELRVEQAMSKQVHTCHPEDKLSAAERTMRVHQVRRLPVVDDVGRILGVLSLNDVCRARAESPLGSLTSDVLTTLAEIGKSSRVRAKVRAQPRERTQQAVEIVSARPENDEPPSSPRVPPPPIRDRSSLFRF